MKCGPHWKPTPTQFSRVSSRANRARQLFGEFVADQIDQDYRKKFHGQGGFDSRVYGDDAFVDQALRQAEQEPLKRLDLAHVISAAKDVFEVSEAELQKPGQGVQISEIRALIAWAVLELSDSTLQELSQWFGRDVSSLSSAIRRLRVKAEKDSAVSGRMGQLRNNLSKFATLQAPQFPHLMCSKGWG